MDTVKSILGILSGIGGWQTTLVAGAVILIALPIVGFIIYRFIKARIQDAAEKAGKDQSMVDQQGKIIGNDQQGEQIKKDEAQSEKDKEASKEKIKT